MKESLLNWGGSKYYSVMKANNVLLTYFNGIQGHVLYELRDIISMYKAMNDLLRERFVL